MSNYTKYPQPQMMLNSAEQIKAFIHPVRLAILEILGRDKRTISSIAKEFGVHPANITHHFKLLERLKLIRMVEKKDNNKNLEKYYRALALRFIVNQEKSGTGIKLAALAVLSKNLDTAGHSLQKNAQASVLALLESSRLLPKDFDQFKRELRKLMNRFSKTDSETGDSFTLNVSLYPTDKIKKVQCTSRRFP